MICGCYFNSSFRSGCISFIILKITLEFPADPFDSSRCIAFPILSWFANFSTWACILAFIGGFERFFSNYSLLRRYLTDSSYWVYLIHILFTMGIALLLRNFTWPAEIKFIIVLFFSTVICLLSYHFLVRGTVIGVFLNGRRY